MPRHSTARWLLLLVLVLPLSAQPALADEPPERVLVDAVLRVTPPIEQGLCMSIGAGQVAVTVQRIEDAVVEPRPARFSLSGLMADPDAGLAMPVMNRETTATTRLSGSPRYCWSIAIDAPETATLPNAQRGGYVQTIAIKIVHRPE